MAERSQKKVLGQFEFITMKTPFTTKSLESLKVGRDLNTLITANHRRSTIRSEIASNVG